jgi:hypothetical protein
MVTDHLSGTNLRRHGKGNAFFKPGCLHQAFLLILHVSAGPFGHKSHTVHQPHLHRGIFSQINAGRFLGNKFGLRGHDGLSCRALWQFIPGPVLLMLIGDTGQYHLLHKPFDKCGLSGPHRPYHSQINFASGPCLNIPVYAVLLHMDTPPANNRLCFLLLLTIYAGVSLLHSILFFSHIKVARTHGE